YQEFFKFRNKKFVHRWVLKRTRRLLTMIYKLAMFRHQHPIIGAGFEFFVVLMAFSSITFPLIYEESLLVLGISSGLFIICFTLFLFFAKIEKIRRSMPN
ncbi:hypothetical protein, partial [Vibrio lentus]